MKPTFSVQVLDNGIVPSSVRFTDTYQDPADRIDKWNFGDGAQAIWDSPDLTSIVHTFKRAGTWRVSALCGLTESDPQYVIVKSAEPVPDPTPVPVTLWGLFIAWIKKLLGW